MLAYKDTNSGKTMTANHVTGEVAPNYENKRTGNYWKVFVSGTKQFVDSARIVMGDGVIDRVSLPCGQKP